MILAIPSCTDHSFQTSVSYKIYSIKYTRF